MALDGAPPDASRATGWQGSSGAVPTRRPLGMVRSGGSSQPKRSRRVAWGVVDQGLSSLSNVAVGFLAARALGADAFGSFALAFATYTLVLGASRSLCTDPLSVRFSASE